jgi:hypothetical protein
MKNEAEERMNEEFKRVITEFVKSEMSIEQLTCNVLKKYPEIAIFIMNDIVRITHELERLGSIIEFMASKNYDKPENVN